MRIAKDQTLSLQNCCFAEKWPQTSDYNHYCREISREFPVNYHHLRPQEHRGCTPLCNTGRSGRLSSTSTAKNAAVIAINSGVAPSSYAGPSRPISDQVRLPWSCHDRVLLSHDPGRCLWSVCDHIRPASAKPTKRSARVDSEYFLTQTTQASPFDSIQFGDDLTAFLCCNLYKNLYPTIFWRSVHSGEVHFYCGALEWLVFSIRRCTTLGVGKLKAAKNPLVIINYKNNGLWLTVECHENSH